MRAIKYLGGYAEERGDEVDGDRRAGGFVDIFNGPQQKGCEKVVHQTFSEQCPAVGILESHNPRLSKSRLE